MDSAIEFLVWFLVGCVLTASAISLVMVSLFLYAGFGWSALIPLAGVLSGGLAAIVITGMARVQDG